MPSVMGQILAVLFLTDSRPGPQVHLVPREEEHSGSMCVPCSRLAPHSKEPRKTDTPFLDPQLLGVRNHALLIMTGSLGCHV